MKRKDYYKFTEKKVNLDNVDQVYREKFVLAGIDNPDVLDAKIEDISDSPVFIPGQKDDLESKDVYQYFRNNMKEILEDGEGFIFFGPKGTGKSSLAGLMLKAVIIYYKKNINVTFVDWTEYLGQYFYNTWSDKPYSVQSEAKAWVRKNMKEAKLLVIDDLGKSKRNYNSIMEHLLEIINYRNRNNLSTIITMNISLQELDQKYDDEHDRLSDRLRQVNLPVGFLGESHRLEQSKELLDKAKKRFDNLDQEKNNSGKGNN